MPPTPVFRDSGLPSSKTPSPPLPHCRAPWRVPGCPGPYNRPLLSGSGTPQLPVPRQGVRVVSWWCVCPQDRKSSTTCRGKFRGPACRPPATPLLEPVEAGLSSRGNQGPCTSPLAHDEPHTKFPPAQQPRGRGASNVESQCNHFAQTPRPQAGQVCASMNT